MHIDISEIKGMFENKNLSQIVRLNTANRQPILFLIDTSYTMSNYAGILKNCIEKIYDALLKDHRLANRIELSIMSFNSNIRILQYLCEIKTHEHRGKNLDIHFEGDRRTGLALKTAIMQLEVRKKTYRNSCPKIKYYPPIIYLVSGGKPECCDDTVEAHENEAMRFSKEYIRQEVTADRLVVISVEVGNKCDHNLMRELTGITTDKHVVSVNSVGDFENFLNTIRYAII